MADYMDSDDFGSPEREVGVGENVPSDLILFLEKWMRTHVMLHGPDKRVLIHDILTCADVLERWGYTEATIVEAVKEKGLRTRLCCEDESRSLRLRNETEQLRVVVEDVLKLQLIPNDMSLIDMMNQDLVSHWLTVFGAQLARERIERLKAAVNSSEHVVLMGPRIAPKSFLQSTSGFCQEGLWQWVLPEESMFGSGYYFNEDSNSEMPQMPSLDSQWQATPMMFMPADHADPETWDQMEQQNWGMRHQRPKRNSAQILIDTVTKLLNENTSQLMEDPSMRLVTLLEMSEHLKCKFGKVEKLAKALMSLGQTSPFFVDERQSTIRFRSLPERLVGACEMLLANKNGPELTLGMAVSAPAVQSLFDLFAHEQVALDSDNQLSRVDSLRHALGYSELLQVMPSVEGGTFDTVDWRSPAEILIGPVEMVLLDSTLSEAGSVMKDEGEVSLALLADDLMISRVLQRAAIKSTQAILTGLQSAIQISSHFELDSSRLSCRPKTQDPGRFASIQPNTEEAEDREVLWSRRRPQLHFVPNDKDPQTLRTLLQFYFQPFNLQHNRVFMSMLQAHFRTSRANGFAHQPYFTIEDICRMPRIREVVSKYGSADGRNCLLAAAFNIQDEEEMPLRLCFDQAAGPKGMCAQKSIWLELSYAPTFRHFQEVQKCQEVRALLAPKIDPRHKNKVEAMKPNTFLVMSYSISSDLSHCSSPKAEELFEATARGDLDPTALFWENRLQKLKRQLFWHSADIICVQGLQSVGRTARCSEVNPRWFSCDNDPIVNHLAFLYRELAKKNYGVVFMPTLKQPDSEQIHLGNAVFWKRNRWEMERYWDAGNCALCVEFTSRLCCPNLLVCCSRAASVYSEEWGQSFSNEELMSELIPVQRELLHHSVRSNLRLLWCGDFGTDSDAVIAELAKKREHQDGPSMHKWCNSTKSVLGHDPWTSCARSTAGQATDLILHDEELQPIAVLNGLPMECHGKSTFLELLQSGYPSDHLIQMAAFMDSSERPLENSRAEVNEARPPLRQRNELDVKAPKMRRVHRKGWRSWQDF